MTPFAEIVQQSAYAAWLFIPSAILLGALHGLEPGHSKTMMAAFIVAIRGTFWQAALLAITATISHTAIVWILALLALTYGNLWSAETTEPYFQIGSAVIIVGIALWMAFRTWQDRRRAKAVRAEGAKRIDTGHGLVELSVFEDGVPPRFRVHFLDRAGRLMPPPEDESVAIETVRPDGARQTFAMAARGTYLESSDVIPEPHAFTASVSIAHGDHAHIYPVVFTEDHHGHGNDAHGHGHGHDHGHVDVHGHRHDHGRGSAHDRGPIPDELAGQDAHARAHAEQIRQRFAGRNVTTGQIALFGLTGGLLPCPAAVTVLILCLQIQQFWLGIVLVLSFSIGLALTLLASGMAAAWGMRHAAGRWPRVDAALTRLPYMASAIIILVGLYVGYSGVAAIT